ncbi:hypothetical protein B0J14DRAFT_573267 [Halenospora varia]|nr:hypothetical protein B0J14DRAFT_573267 [Halenospora varia]
MMKLTSLMDLCWPFLAVPLRLSHYSLATVVPSRQTRIEQVIRSHLQYPQKHHCILASKFRSLLNFFQKNTVTGGSLDVVDFRTIVTRSCRSLVIISLS